MRPMVKELALYNLQFFSYGQKTVFLSSFLYITAKYKFNNTKNDDHSRQNLEI